MHKRGEKSNNSNENDLGWAYVLVLESLIPLMVDLVIGKSRLLVTPSVKERAKEITETWKANLEEREGRLCWGEGWGCLEVMKREERIIFLLYVDPT